MNMFYLDENSRIAATYHCDKHVVKQIVESCQLLSNALPEEFAPYRRTHYNHPCSIWVRQSIQHWLWLHKLTMGLFLEWKDRYKHTRIEEHKCYPIWDEMTSYAVDFLADNGFISPPQCMPDDCKCDNTVAAYRKYYMTHKRHLAHWKNQKPHWYE